MKKLCSFMLAATIVAMILSGCGGSSAKPASQPAKTESAVSSAATAETPAETFSESGKGIKKIDLPKAEGESDNTAAGKIVLLDNEDLQILLNDIEPLEENGFFGGIMNVTIENKTGAKRLGVTNCRVNGNDSPMGFYVDNNSSSGGKEIPANSTFDEKILIHAINPEELTNIEIGFRTSKDWDKVYDAQPVYPKGEENAKKSESASASGEGFPSLMTTDGYPYIDIETKSKKGKLYYHPEILFDVASYGSSIVMAGIDEAVVEAFMMDLYEHASVEEFVKYTVDNLSRSREDVVATAIEERQHAGVTIKTFHVDYNKKSYISDEKIENMSDEEIAKLDFKLVPESKEYNVVEHESGWLLALRGPLVEDEAEFTAIFNAIKIVAE